MGRALWRRSPSVVLAMKSGIVWKSATLLAVECHGVLVFVFAFSEKWPVQSKVFLFLRMKNNFTLAQNYTDGLSPHSMHALLSRQ